MVVDYSKHSIKKTGQEESCRLSQLILKHNQKDGLNNNKKNLRDPIKHGMFLKKV